jgi:hypothetical protein
MQDLLTEYLLQYRKVYVPHFGAVEILQSPARVDFVDKMIYPPQFNTRLRKSGELTEHQLNFLVAATKSDKESVRTELDSLGKELQDQFISGSFTWDGIGAFSSYGSDVPFNVSSLEPISAERVQRVNAQHQVLMGDQHVMVQQHDQSVDPAYEALFGEKTRSKHWVAWVILAIAVLVILYFLYSGNFTTYSSGLKTHP